MGKSQRIKGHSFERSVANDFKKIFGEGKRGLQSRNGEDGVADVETPYFFIECKAHKKTPIRAALDQAIKNCPKEKIPLAILKDDYQDVCVYLKYNDFMAIIEEWHKLKTQGCDQEIMKTIKDMEARLLNITTKIKEINNGTTS